MLTGHDKILYSTSVQNVGIFLTQVKLNDRRAYSDIMYKEQIYEYS